jgi:serine/threonine protein kinase
LPLAETLLSPPGPGAGDATEQVPNLGFLSPAEGPDELGGFRVLRLLGAGGMGLVLEAEDVRMRRRVALKVLRPAIAREPQARERFLREARAAGKLSHDHVLTVHQVGEDNGVPFLAMPLLRGETLEQRLQRERRLPLPEVLRIGREIAEGLAAAHEQGLIHRDVKPANVWLEAPKGRVKLLDFGLARAQSGEARLTATDAAIGTPSPSAPGCRRCRRRRRPVGCTGCRPRPNGSMPVAPAPTRPSGGAVRRPRCGPTSTARSPTAMPRPGWP